MVAFTLSSPSGSPCGLSPALQYTAHGGHTRNTDLPDIDPQETREWKDALEAVKLRGTVKEQTEKMKQRIEYTLSYLEVQTLDLPQKYATAAKEIKEAVNRIMATAEARATRRLNSSPEGLSLLFP